MNTNIYKMMLILMIFVLSGCAIDNKKPDGDRENVQLEINEDQLKISPVDNEQVKIHSKQSEDQQLIDFVEEFLDGIMTPDAEKFKELVDGDGIYSFNYFVDGRDESRVIYVNKEEIREDLLLVSSQSGKVGLSLTGLTGYRISEVKINRSDFLEEFSFDIDWHVNDETIMQKHLLNIKNKCRELILTNNEYIHQIFVLNDNYYAFSFSNIYFKEYQERLNLESTEKYEEFTGYWVVFKKTESKYLIRAIIKLQ